MRIEFLISAFAVLGQAHFSFHHGNPIPNLVDASTSDADTLSITLSAIDDHHIVVTTWNNGPSPLRLLRWGTYMAGDDHVHDLRLAQNGHMIPSQALHKEYDYSQTRKEDYLHLAPGSSTKHILDLSRTYDLTNNGSLSVSLTTKLYALESKGSRITHVPLPVSASAIEMPIDLSNFRAARGSYSELKRRAFVADDCPVDNKIIINQAQADCNAYCSKSSKQALATDATSTALFKKYFFTDDTASRNAVSARLSAIASECGQSGRGSKSGIFCVDYAKGCSFGTIAYTDPGSGDMVICPSYFKKKVPISGKAFEQSFTETIIHEFTHAEPIYKPATEDFAYGPRVLKLTQQKALLNADSFALYVLEGNLGAKKLGFFD